MNGQLPWYVARAAGIVSWVLLTASVLWGLTMTTDFVRGHVKKAVLLDLHRYLGGLAAIFVGVHVVALLADTFVHFTLTSVLVPFVSTWHPVAVAWGIVAAYLLLAVELTSLARAQLPRRLWRAIHFASFPLFVVATVHGFNAGTDAHSWLFEGVMVGAIAAVGFLTVRRVMTDRGRRSHRPVPLANL
jgi:predicted ferric reductase